jgi:hypothetical protein
VPGNLSDFTPFGYLRNPAHHATSWSETRGGNLRAAPDYVGVEWVYPVGRDATSRAGLGLETTVDGRACRTRGDFEAIGLTSRYHTASILGFDWYVDGLQVEARFFLLEDDTLCLRLVLRNTALNARRGEIRIVERVQGEPPEIHTLVGSTAVEATLAPSEERTAYAVLTRGASLPWRAASHPPMEMASRPGEAAEAVARCESAYNVALAEDQQFEATCPTLSGDWPAHWREGLHHDFQTTRVLVQPPGGIFQDVWPAWMAAWPRVVLAEGTLDMLRLAYADAPLAQRAVLSLFRDAPQPNVPCVFRGGEYNMVAADGSRCGTSPAWCLPFLNLELLYLRTLDREWLAQVHPYAAAYLEWWLEHRVDSEGWLVYKCTWESGEDGNPRLDPTGSGDADISGRVRPVELQASMAHAAGVMAFFADQLGLPAERWRALEDDYRARTRRMFDAAAGRYRDWLIAEQRFSEPCPDGSYWGVDPCRYSAQSVTPLLIGEPLAEGEISRHITPPWTLWPSWTYSLVESAAAAGHYARVGALAFETVDRVYRVTTRRDVVGLARPMPGSAPEFWPEDWRAYGGSDAYGWGATTANLLIRHLFGFKESRQTDGWVAELTPSFPPSMLQAGSRYSIRKLNYRGVAFDLTYLVGPDDLAVHLELSQEPRQLTLERLDARARVVATELYPSGRSHSFHAQVGDRLRVRLT